MAIRPSPTSAFPIPEPATPNGPPRDVGKYGRPTYNQARKIIVKFGGEAKIARILGVHRSSPYRWNWAPPVGSDGLIPGRIVSKILKAARAEGILLTEEDWLPERIDYNAPAPEPIQLEDPK